MRTGELNFIIEYWVYKENIYWPRFYNFEVKKKIDECDWV